MAQLLQIVLLLVALGTHSNCIRVRRVIHGDIVEEGKAPFVVILKYDNLLTCGGVIISSTEILTSAFCVERCQTDFEKCLKYMTITAGSTKLTKGGDVYKIKSIKVHQNFKNEKFANDLAIITPASEIKISESVKTIDLPEKNIIENSHVDAYGWGRTGVENESKLSNDLLTLQEKIISNEKCNEIFGNTKVDDNDLCVIPVDSTSNAGLCVGDSGGPLVQDGKVVGISSWGRGCGNGNPDVFVNVYKHLSFIKME